LVLGTLAAFAVAIAVGLPYYLFVRDRKVQPKEAKGNEGRA
jgi:hypothetical protein